MNEVPFSGRGENARVAVKKLAVAQNLVKKNVREAVKQVAHLQQIVVTKKNLIVKIKKKKSKIQDSCVDVDSLIIRKIKY